MEKPTFRESLIVPPFCAKLWVVLADDIDLARFEMNDQLGPIKYNESGYEALTCSHGATFGVFFSHSNWRKLSVFNHEMFHLTHRILDCYECGFDSKHHEIGAYLHGWLSVEVQQLCRQAGKKAT